VLLYRQRDGVLEVFLIHMGGPIWAKKDDGAWSIPKGIIGEQEDPLMAARREFLEETGSPVDGAFVALGTISQNSGKKLSVWALEGDFDPAELKSNLFSMEWPPKSGRIKHFPEADRGDWFAGRGAVTKIVKGQKPILDRFLERMFPS
jgi:predicted NUDIX family NTP pyrophosphohydrolase